MTSTLDVDPAFAAVVKALYGGAVDPSELAKSLDAADVHIETTITKPKPRLRKVLVQKSHPAAATGDPKKDRRIAAVGLGATGVAALGGVHAIAATRVENAERAARAVGHAPKPKPVWVAPKVLRGVKPGRAASIVGGGALALHGVELVGDGLAARAQAKALRKTPVEKGVKLTLRPLGVRTPRPPSLRARRPAGSPAVVKALSPELATALRGAASGRLAPFSRTGVPVKPKLKYLGRHRAPSELQTALRQVRRGSVMPFSRTGRPVAKSVDADVEIAKVDTDKRQVFGWANVAKMNGLVVRDRQGDEIDIDELEKAAYDYVLDSRIGGDQHARITKSFDGTPKHTSDVIESMVFTPEKIEKMGLPDNFPQAWWIGMQVNDPETWELIKSGKRTGFSVHGTGRRESIEKAERKKAETVYGGEPREKRVFDPKALTARAAASQAPKVLKKITVKDRVAQAKNPPPVQRKAVSSTAVRSIGYQPQTRRLSVEMTTRPGQPYEYRTKKKVAHGVIDAESKGQAYNATIRGKQPRHERFTVGDRGRLFLKPDRS